MLREVRAELAPADYDRIDSAAVAAALRAFTG